MELLEAQENTVTITAFVSEDLPPELALKGKEVLNLLKLIERSAPDVVRLAIHRPKDTLDEKGSMASEHFGLTPQQVSVETVTGRDRREVFLAAIISSGTRTERIEHFMPGLSVEYEIVRAIRTASTIKRKVVGFARTDIDMLGGFDYQKRSMKFPLVHILFLAILFLSSAYSFLHLKWKSVNNLLITCQ